jgi:hypothetical protein
MLAKGMETACSVQRGIGAPHATGLFIVGSFGAPRFAAIGIGVAWTAARGWGEYGARTVLHQDNRKFRGLIKVNCFCIFAKTFLNFRI